MEHKLMEKTAPTFRSEVEFSVFIVAQTVLGMPGCYVLQILEAAKRARAF